MTVSSIVHRENPGTIGHLIPPVEYIVSIGASLATAQSIRKKGTDPEREDPIRIEPITPSDSGSVSPRRWRPESAGHVDYGTLTADHRRFTRNSGLVVTADPVRFGGKVGASLVSGWCR